MTIRIDDWIFDVDPVKTKAHSEFALNSHCTCGYCENYYRGVDLEYPGLRAFLDRFFVEIEGPSEMYPFEPTQYLLAYKVNGRIVQAGAAPIMVDGVPIMGEIIDDDTFKLEVGEIELPWILDEDMDEVVSPANEPEFLERMYQKMIQRNSSNFMFLS
ncbi:MAG: hypothetical protein J6C98_04870 [Oscillospiraceae bacterium]|nr:hypothetical protein [Oscillospiraceae bacterium]